VTGERLTGTVGVGVGTESRFSFPEIGFQNSIAGRFELSDATVAQRL